MRNILKKDPKMMDDKEAWAVFFKYGEDIEKRELINEIIIKEKGVNMAVQTLLTISKDEIMRHKISQE